MYFIFINLIFREDNAHAAVFLSRKRRHLQPVDYSPDNKRLEWDYIEEYIQTPVDDLQDLTAKVNLSGSVNYSKPDCGEYVQSTFLETNVWKPY